MSVETRAQSEMASIQHQEINQVMSDDGDCMELHRPVPLHKTVEQWVARLQESVAETLRTDIYSCVRDLDNGLPYEELVSKVNLLQKQNSNCSTNLFICFSNNF